MQPSSHSSSILDFYQDLVLKLLSRTLDSVDDEDWTLQLGVRFGQHYELYNGIPELRVCRESPATRRAPCFPAPHPSPHRNPCAEHGVKVPWCCHAQIHQQRLVADGNFDSHCQINTPSSPTQSSSTTICT